MTGTSATYPGLTNGTSYAFSVRAVTREHGMPTGPPVQGAAATATATPGRTPTVNVTAATLSGDRQVTVHVVVTDYGSGPVTCHLFFNGTELRAGLCSGSSDIPVGGLAYSTTYDVYATGSNSSFGTGPAGSHASVRTNDPPPPPPTITVSKGAPTSKPGCTIACYFVQISLQNFAPNTSYSLSCVSDYPPPVGPFYTQPIRTDGGGSYNTSSLCWYGYTGHQVWVTAGGVTSNTVTW